MIFILLPILLVSINAKDNQDRCKWTEYHGNQYDLNPLKKQTNYQLPDTESSMGMFNMVYEFNFCTTGVQCQSQEVAAFEALEVLGKITENCDALGKVESQEIKLLNPTDPGFGIQVTYSQGDMCFDVKESEDITSIAGDNQQMAMIPRSITYELTCSSNNDLNFHVIDSTKCNIRLGINHIAGCPLSFYSSNSTSYFKYILILGFIYLSVGFMYNQKTNGLQGIEAIPNIDFWRTTPSMIFSLLNSVLGFIQKYKGNNSNGSGNRGYETV